MPRVKPVQERLSFFAATPRPLPLPLSDLRHRLHPVWLVEMGRLWVKRFAAGRTPGS
jgi:hypothetical protein